MKWTQLLREIRKMRFEEAYAGSSARRFAPRFPPQSVTLMQLRFTSFAVSNLRRDFHPQELARAGRTKKKNRQRWRFLL
jgi:hypothetical protein